jgi:hypothetical protein
MKNKIRKDDSQFLCVPLETLNTHNVQLYLNEFCPLILHSKLHVYLVILALF